jgi:uncharacterized repeat protein (TIGR04076 family)
MVETPNIGIKISAEILNIKGKCNAGHTKGQKFLISCYDSGGLCGYFYHDIFPNISVMQYGGRYPWEESNAIIVECPDRFNAVSLKLIKSQSDVSKSKDRD